MTDLIQCHYVLTRIIVKILFYSYLLLGVR